MKFATGDCRIGDCQRPVDHRGSHGPMTAGERRTYDARRAAQATTIAAPDIFADEAWGIWPR